MERVFLEKRDCCGCGTCSQACPVDAIEMKRDSEGFCYPQINSKYCVDCGTCQKVCPFLHSEELKEGEPSAAYAAKHKKENVLLESTSGGAFTALSDLVLAKNGVIYGASFLRDWHDDAAEAESSPDDIEQFPFFVRHFRAESETERDRFRFSKYVQSDLGVCLGEIQQDLSAGKIVLFTGTPCQNAGLRSYCTKKDGRLPKNLILCDLICHSVPSPKIWRDFVKTLEKETCDGGPGALDRAQFRTKDSPWSRLSKSFLFTRRGSDRVYMDDRYHRLLFQLGTAARPSCGACPFADLRRVSDLTIADYWGIEKYLPQFMDGRGVSLILANTEKGTELFKEMKKSMDWCVRPLAECVAEQPRLRGVMTKPEGREEFWNLWNQGVLNFETLFLESDKNGEKSQEYRL